jgi:two-component system response regulator
MVTKGEIEILLVDDNPSDIELTVHVLRQNKLANRIQIAEDGKEALDFMFCRGKYEGRSFEDRPRVILLDLKLPKVGGLDVLKALKSDPRTKSTPVVIFSSSKEQRDLIEGYKLGVSAYIQKPVDFEEFRKVIREIGLFWMIANQPPPPEVFANDPQPPE